MTKTIGIHLYGDLGDVLARPAEMRHFAIGIALYLPCSWV